MYWVGREIYVSGKFLEGIVLIAQKVFTGCFDDDDDDDDDGGGGVLTNFAESSEVKHHHRVRTMTSRGQAETSQLRANLQDQLDRLVAQLADLEECKNDLDADEYEETKKETIEQMEDFNRYLAKLASGDMTLVDQIGSMQLAIQAAISNAFQTPEIIRLFARKQPSQLRVKLSQIERDFKIGSLTRELYTQQKREILSALQKLGDTLLDEESVFLQNNLTDSLKEFNKLLNENVTEESVSNLINNSKQ